MKECPVCKNKLDDDARFCLYCMTSLHEKEVIPPLKPGFRRWLLPAAFVLLAVVLLSVLCVIMLWPGQASSNNGVPPMMQLPDHLRQTTAAAEGEETTAATVQLQSPESLIPVVDVMTPIIDPVGTVQPSATTGQTAVQTTAAATSQTTAPKPTAPKPTAPKPTAPDMTVPQTTAPKATTPIPSTEATTATTVETTAATTVSTEPALPIEVVGNGIPGSEGYRTSLSQADPYEDMHQPFWPTGGFGCSLATPEDMADEAYVNPGDECVAINVGTYTRHGIYDMRDMDFERDRVVCIGYGALSASDAVKVIVSSDVRYIGAYAFDSCDELAYIYLTGDEVRFHKNAFSTSGSRKYRVYLYCSAQCQDGSGNYYKDIAGRYGLVWREWNG